MTQPTTPAHEPPRPQRRHTQPLLAIVIVALAAAMGPSSATAATDGSSPSLAPADAGTPFTSRFGYSLMLPPGWQVVPESQTPDSGQDLFEGPMGTAYVGSGGPSEPGETVADRVAANRADLACQSDPADDRSTTLGGEEAIEWTWQCGGWTYIGINAIHDGLRLRLTVGMPAVAEAEARPLLVQLADGLTFTDAESEPTGAAVAAIDATLQGTFETAWHPVELEAAALEAAGLAPELDYISATDTVRWAVRFQNGLLTLYHGADGGAYSIAWQGTYQLLDDNTIEAIDGSSGYPIVYAFQLRDDILTMDVLSDAYPDPGDLIAQTGIYETLPFTRVP